MSRLTVYGGDFLQGELTIQGSKNATLPLMAASLLQQGITLLRNVPDIEDVRCAIDILRFLGVKVDFQQGIMKIDAATLLHTTIPIEYMEKMRSSIIFMGALLSRCGQVKAYQPGGCCIGKRPIDLHLFAFKQLGAQVNKEGKEVVVKANALKPAKINFPFSSVGATQNALLAACGVQGVSCIENAAREPEVVELCWFLQAMGCPIEGIGTNRLIIYGKNPLFGICYQVSSDRIVAGTYLCACMLTKGRLILHQVPIKFMKETLRLAKIIGADYQGNEEEFEFKMENRPCAVPYLTTMPYPGFPTDMQSLFMAVLSKAKGRSIIKENIFEDRMQAVEELKKMGADIYLNQKEQIAFVEGVEQLNGNLVYARDLRTGAALTIAGLSAKGKTIVEGYEYIARGYEAIERDLVQLGGNVCLTG